MSMTAENCGVLGKNAIDRAEALYNCKVKNVVTNNAKNMEMMTKNAH